MTSPTPTRLLIEERLGQGIAEFVAARRPLRVPSWRELAQEIADKTGVVVTDEAVRKWANGPEDTAEQTASAS